VNEPNKKLWKSIRKVGYDLEISLRPLLVEDVKGQDSSRIITNCSLVRV